MKTKYLIYMLLFLGIALSSCREISIKTTINYDGSFTRTIIIKGDSTEVLDMDLPYPVDSSWMKEVHRDTADSNAYICILSKSYKGVDELNSEIRNDSSWRKQIDREVTISKRFMFFYSFLTYKQVYRAANTFDTDFHSYLNKEDILWISGVNTPVNWKDSIRYDSAEARLDSYYKNTLVYEISLALEKGIAKLNDPQLNTIDLSNYSDSISAHVMGWSSGSYDNSIDALIEWTQKPGLSALHNIKPPIFKELEDKDEFSDNLLFDEEYTHEVEMPGLITETNSTMIVGNTVSWEIKPLSYFFEDYEMTAESRVVNYWAFILSGFVVLLLLIALIVKIFR